MQTADAGPPAVDLQCVTQACGIRKQCLLCAGIVQHAAGGEWSGWGSGMWQALSGCDVSEGPLPAPAQRSIAWQRLSAEHAEQSIDQCILLNEGCTAYQAGRNVITL